MADDPSLTSEPTGSSGRGQRAAQEEPLDAILSPELDKMVTDGEFSADERVWVFFSAIFTLSGFMHASDFHLMSVTG